jgi:hypothetical protein
VGKPNLPWVDFSDQDTQNGMQQNGLPAEVAKNYTEMGSALRSGEMVREYNQHKPASFGPTKLEHFAPVFAEVYAKA